MQEEQIRGNDIILDDDDDDDEWYDSARKKSLTEAGSSGEC